jgi:hypothetical protein
MRRPIVAALAERGDRIRFREGGTVASEATDGFVASSCQSWTKNDTHYPHSIKQTLQTSRPTPIQTDAQYFGRLDVSLIDGGVPGWGFR